MTPPCDSGRTRTLGSPYSCQGALLAEACFILEPHFDRAVGVLVLYVLDKRGAS